MKFSRILLILAIVFGFSSASVYIQSSFYSFYSFENHYLVEKNKSFWNSSYLHLGRVSLSSGKGLKLDFTKDGTGYMSLKTGSVKKILDGLPLLRFKISYKF